MPRNITFTYRALSGYQVDIEIKSPRLSQKGLYSLCITLDSHEFRVLDAKSNSTRALVRVFCRHVENLAVHSKCLYAAYERGVK